MASMHYDDEAAARLEAVYRTADIVAQRRYTLDLLRLKPGEAVLDLGSGPGFLCQEMAEVVGPTGRVRGVDVSRDFLRRAEGRNDCPWLSYAEADATDLPEPDAAYDVVVSTQVAEYVPDVARFCAEAFRVLRPGGRGAILATDWPSLAWHSEDPARMQRVLDAFAPHCADSGLPRRLAPHLHAAGFELTRVSSFPIVNLDWGDDLYSRLTAGFIAAYVRKQKALPEAEVAAWEAELDALAAEGRYFFLINRVFFEVRRPDQSAAGALTPRSAEGAA